MRSTTNPITGAASASAPVPQGTTTNSSLGLTVAFPAPARVSFLFALNCNNNNGDHLDFFVDGVLTAQLSTVTSNTLVGGRFVTDLLREGPHTFDWRFVRGGTASVGSEECKIDTVEIISDETWRGDPARVFFFDDGFTNATTNAGTVANLALFPPWFFGAGANNGTYGLGSFAAAPFGTFEIRCAAVAAGDYAAISTQAANFLPAGLPFCEARVTTPDTLTVNKIVEVGLSDTNVPTGGNFIGWAWDGSNGAGSTWRNRAINVGAATNSDSNIAAVASTYYRLGVTVATVRGVTGAVFTRDGKALPGAASVPPLMVVGLPTAALRPTFRVRSITAAATSVAILDWMRFLALR